MDSLDLIYLKGKGTPDLTREKGRNLVVKNEKKERDGYDFCDQVLDDDKPLQGIL